jgi:hypothetical protein
MTSKAASIIGEYRNSLNVPTASEEKEINKQSKKILKSSLIPGLEFSLTDLTESPKKKNPTARVGCVKKKKKA